MLILVRMMLLREPTERIYVSGNALVSFVWRVGSWRGAGAGYRFEEWGERGALLGPWSDFVVDAVAKNSALIAWAHCCMGGGDPGRRSDVETRAHLVADFFEAFQSQAYSKDNPLYWGIPNSNFSICPSDSSPLVLNLIFLLCDSLSAPHALFPCGRFSHAHDEIRGILHQLSEMRVCGGVAHIRPVRGRNCPGFGKRA